MPIAELIADFDALMVSVSEKVLNEYNNQRIIGSDYSTVYLGSMQAALNTALGYATVGPEAELLAQKKLTEEAQIKDILSDGTVVYTPTVDTPADQTYAFAIGKGVLGKQQVLYTKQTDGFDRDAEQKLLKILNDLYAINMSVADGIPLPAQNNENGIDNVIESAKINLGISTATTP